RGPGCSCLFSSSFPLFLLLLFILHPTIFRERSWLESQIPLSQVNESSVYVEYHFSFASRLCIMNTLSEANGNFAIYLLKMLCENNPSKNVCYSPMSISSALAMVLLGAKGDTAVQMSQVSCVSSHTYKDIHQGFQSLLSNLNKPNRKYLLRMANRLFAESTCEFLPVSYINRMIDSTPEPWKIPELLLGGSVDSATRLVLVNALYFKGKWQKEFDKERTREMPFKINQRETRPVQMMYQKDVFKLAYVKEVEAKMLVMPYDGMELSLIVLLPVDGVDLSKVENNLTFEKLMSWTKPDFMRSTRAEVLLPKFKLQEDYDMKSVFQHLGMVDVFQEGKADLSGMSLERNLCVSECVHKSVVEVNEEGTEAAASTMVNICCYSSGGDPRFCADHPFLFFIRHNETNTLLFCGRFSSP
uniref:Serpin domain-containing protein n=1 Tax=Peromyscus maniculatus bairdii TaxID=230844 RepID=A0A8C8UQP7_PERMB